MEKIEKKRIIQPLQFCAIMGLNIIIMSVLYFNYFFHLYNYSPGNGAILWIPPYHTYALLWMIPTTYVIYRFLRHWMLGEKRKSKGMFWVCYIIGIAFLFTLTICLHGNYRSIFQDTMDEPGGAIFSLPSYSQKKGNKVTIYKALKREGIKSSWISQRGSGHYNINNKIGEYKGVVTYNIGMDYLVRFDWDTEEIVSIKKIE